MGMIQGDFKRFLGASLLGKTRYGKMSIGLYLDALPLRAIVLTNIRSQWHLVGKYEWMPEDSAQQATIDNKDRLITVGNWQHFLHYLVNELSQHCASEKAFICQQLQVTVGIDYQTCAWLPMPQLTKAQVKDQGHSPMIHWKRSAATHWQVSPQDVWVDVLVLGEKAGLLGSLPKQSLQAYIDHLNILQPLSKQPIQAGVSTHLDCLLQIWPWVTRQQLVLIDLHKGKATYLDTLSIHTTKINQLPKHITQGLLCGDSSLDGHGCRLQNEPLTAPISLWRWGVQDLTKHWLIPWHLAFMPPVKIKHKARPLAAWQANQVVG